MRPARGIAVAFACLAPACSLLIDTTGLVQDHASATGDGSTSAAGDASGAGLDSAAGYDAPSTTVGDSAPAGDSAAGGVDGSVETMPDAGPDGGVVSVPGSNLLENPSFDTGSGVCGAEWSAYGDYTSYDTSPIAHTGAASCKLCGPGYLSLRTDQVASAPSGATYKLEAWIRLDPELPGNAAMALGVSIGTAGATKSFTSQQATDVWTKFSANLTVQGPDVGKNLHFYLSGTPSNDVCFLVDDLAMTRL